MLRELSNVRQIEGRQKRRWFQSSAEDLIVWYDGDGRISGFQLCYDRNRNERAVTWLSGRGYSHDRVDADARRGLKYAQTPILVADGAFDAPAMTSRFLDIAVSVPDDVRQFVVTKLHEYPETLAE